MQLTPAMLCKDAGLCQPLGVVPRRLRPSRGLESVASTGAITGSAHGPQSCKHGPIRDPCPSMCDLRSDSVKYLQQ